MSIDKTIRIGVDAGSASQDVSKIRGQVDKANAQSAEGIKEQIRLLKEKAKIEADISRQKIKDRQEDINFAERELQLWKLQRDAQARTMQGATKTRFDRATRDEENARKIDIIRDRGSLADTRIGGTEEANDRKKQIKELQEIAATIRGESKKSRESEQTLLEKVLVSAGVGPNTAKSLVDYSNSPIGKIVKGLYAVSAVASASEEGLRRYSTNINQSASTSVYDAMNYSLSLKGKYIGGILGKTTKSFMEEDLSRYQTAYGSRNLKGGWEEGIELAAASRARGLTSEQVGGTLNISRYSGASAINQIGSMENFLQKTGQSLVRMPEIMDTYLKTANSILERTGNIDPIAIQRMIQSIGSSYGYQGMNLNRNVSNMESMGKMSENSIYKSYQYQAARKAYPNKSLWELQEVFQNPLQFERYMSSLIDITKKSGGGGDFSKMNLQKLFPGMSFSDINTMYSKGFKIEEPTVKPEGFYEKVSEKQVGAGETFFTSFKEWYNNLVETGAVLSIDGLSKVLLGAGFQEENARSMEKAFNGALRTNKNWMENR